MDLSTVDIHHDFCRGLLADWLEESGAPERCVRYLRGTDGHRWRRALHDARKWWARVNVVPPEAPPVD